MSHVFDLRTLALKGQDQILDALRIGQQAVVHAVAAAPRPAVPTSSELVDDTFGFVEKLVATQREFARNLVAATAPAEANR